MLIGGANMERRFNWHQDSMNEGLESYSGSFPIGSRRQASRANPGVNLVHHESVKEAGFQ